MDGEERPKVTFVGFDDEEEDPRWEETQRIMTALALEDWIVWLWMQEKDAGNADVERIRKLRSFLSKYGREQGMHLFEV